MIFAAHPPKHTNTFFYSGWTGCAVYFFRDPLKKTNLISCQRILYFLSPLGLVWFTLLCLLRAGFVLNEQIETRICVVLRYSWFQKYHFWLARQWFWLWFYQCSNAKRSLIRSYDIEDPYCLGSLSTRNLNQFTIRDHYNWLSFYKAKTVI